MKSYIGLYPFSTFFRVFVNDRAWRDTQRWHEKETKMFNAYIARFSSKIRDMFNIAPQHSDSEENKRRKERVFKSIESKLRDIMEKRHYVSIIRKCLA